MLHALFLHLLFQILRLTELPQLLLIFFMYLLPYVPLHALFEKNIPACVCLECASIPFVPAQRNTFARIQIIKADHIVINGQRTHQVCLAAFLFLFLKLLFGAVQQKPLVKQLPVFH